jgi:MoaA/NifB/PqqE/SkfB family radical SAM enzyme
MYKLADIKRVHLEISEICNAACPMCARFVGGGRALVPYMNNDSISLEYFKQIFDLDFIEQVDKWVICGVLGDPCTAKDLIPIIEHILKYNENARISLETNGGIRDTSWWHNLGSLCNTANRSVVFSIDGLSDTNHLYRRNVQWDKVIENLKAFTNAGGYAAWQYIRFQHNEHQVEEARLLAQQLKCSKFTVKNTNRFRKQHDNEYKYPVKKLGSNDIDYWLYPPTDFIPAKLDDKNLNSVSINCIAKERSEVYVNAKGEVFPCCYIFSDMKDNKDNYSNIHNKINDTTTLQDIVESDFFNYIERSWSKTLGNGRIKKCADVCGVNNRVTQLHTKISNT